MRLCHLLSPRSGRVILGLPVIGLAAVLASACGGGDSGGTNVGSSGGAAGSQDASSESSVGGSSGKGGSSATGGSAGTSGSGGQTEAGIPDASKDASDDGSAGQSGDADAAFSCKADADCVGNAAGPFCDTATGHCVACSTTEASSCDQGQWCDPSTFTCKPGCDDAQDCTDGTVCDSAGHTCVGCVSDSECPLGQTCQATVCAPGCSQLHQCQNGATCCSGQCVSIDSDPSNCGVCGFVCNLPNAKALCIGGKCDIDECLPDWKDCDQKAANGCEAAQCLCEANATEPCYTGPAGTQDVGPCHGGTRTCNDTGTAWGSCEGEVVPSPESCFTAIDDDCNGQVNESGPGCTCQPNATQACYTGAPATRGVGACKDGQHTCNASGTAWGPCDGEVLPSTETCSTPVDDDCDGQVNEVGGTGCLCTPGSADSCYGGPPGTAGVGACKAGTQTCNSSGTGWEACTGDVVPSPDVCTDNLDNDCNGVLNDGVLAGAAGCVCMPSSSVACYSGPQGTKGVGVCVGGTATCNPGGTALGACNGEVTPSPDSCNDSLDNNCNGIVNDGAGNGGAGCVCIPGAQIECYEGPAGTLGKGVCDSGLKTCEPDGKSWGPCWGQTIPDLDRCDNSLDDDCNGTVNDGFANNAPGCVCTPGASAACYTGPAGTQGVGTCKAGTHTCSASGTSWSPCTGEVTPVVEVCGNNLDDDCNGTKDDIADTDGDGWTRCNGDCCENDTQCGSPRLVNPGAFEVASNGVDDDCDGNIDNPLGNCDGALASDAADPLDYARAIDLCQFTTETPPLNQKKWGVISAWLQRADGTSTPNTLSRSIRPGFGTAITPRKGSNLAVLSTGRAADVNDTNPAFAAFQGGQDMGVTSGPPADWLAANGNTFPNAPGCPAPQGGTTARDPAMLKIRIRVPTNAKSFSVMPYFFSSEYPEWTCSPYNDFFVTLLNSTWSGVPANPADRNLAFYASGNQKYPVGVNLAYGNTGLFRQCLNGPTGCGGGSVPGTCNTCLGITELAGTGFDTVNPPSQFMDDPGWCGSSNRLGGGTGWLTTNGNVNPGETIEVRFAIWDTGDQWYDSLVLLDNFTWSLNSSTPGTNL